LFSLICESGRRVGFAITDLRRGDLLIDLLIYAHRPLLAKKELREQVEECMEWVHPATHDQRHDGLRVQRQQHHTDVAPADTEPY
jgi:hypothetical protein